MLQVFCDALYGSESGVGREVGRVIAVDEEEDIKGGASSEVVVAEGTVGGEKETGVE